MFIQSINLKVFFVICIFMYLNLVPVVYAKPILKWGLTFNLKKDKLLHKIKLSFFR